MSTEPGQPPPTLRPASFAEAAAMEGYREAIKGALSAADSTADKVVTASLSVATAYGALLALVTPEGQATPAALGFPFAAIALALVLAMWAQSTGVTLDATNVVDQIESRVRSTVGTKRKFTRAAVFALVAGLTIAGFVVAANFGVSTGDETETAVVALSARGQAIVADLCGTTPAGTVEGLIDPNELDNRFIAVHVSDAACMDRLAIIQLPSTVITGIRLPQ